MPLDAELVAETRAWFVRAGDDLRAGDLLLAASPAVPGSAVFHAQQAAEKAMKGFLTRHSRPFRKTHNLTELGGRCSSVDATLEPLCRRASRLTDYAWKYRYPGEPSEPSVSEVKEALALAREVYQAIIARLPAEVRP